MSGVPHGWPPPGGVPPYGAPYPPYGPPNPGYGVQQPQPPYYDQSQQYYGPQYGQPPLYFDQSQQPYLPQQPYRPPQQQQHSPKSSLPRSDPTPLPVRSKYDSNGGKERPKRRDSDPVVTRNQHSQSNPSRNCHKGIGLSITLKPGEKILITHGQEKTNKKRAGKTKERNDDEGHRKDLSEEAEESRLYTGQSNDGIGRWLAGIPGATKAHEDIKQPKNPEKPKPKVKK